MKRLIIVLVLLMLTGCESKNVNETGIDIKTYINPVFEPVMADPTIIKGDDGYFYAYATEDFWDWETGTHNVAIIKSKDLINWEYVNDAFDFKPNWSGFAHIWAPEILKMNNKYYLYYSLSVWADDNPGIGVAVADSPEGPFEDKGKLFDSNEIGVENSIDPYVYITEDNEKWMFWGSFRGIYAIKLSEDGLSTVGEKVHIAGNMFEATYILEKDGYYYMFNSTGSCCNGEDSTYSIKVSRSTSLLGPYVNKRGQDVRYSDGSLVMGAGEQYVGVGHNSMIKDDLGDYWIVYHGINIDNPYLGNGATRRPLMIDKLIWSADGWPQVKNFVPSEDEAQVPYIKEEE